MNKEEFDLMKEREKNLNDNGFIDYARRLFSKIEIIEDGKEKPSTYTINSYYTLLADYICCIVDSKNSIIKEEDVIGLLSESLNRIVEKDFNSEGIGEESSYLEGDTIYINSQVLYRMQKLALFKELTTLLFEKKYYNNHNSNRDSFVENGVIQYTFEKLEDISNSEETDFNNYELIGIPNHKTYSNLRKYKLNEDILILLSLALGQSLDELASLGFVYNGRQLLSNIFESQKGNTISFDELMETLDKIQTIGDEIDSKGTDEMKYNHSFKSIRTSYDNEVVANLDIYNSLIIRVEKELISIFMYNRTNSEIRNNYELFMQCLTTDELKNEFMELINLELEEIKDKKRVI